MPDGQSECLNLLWHPSLSESCGSDLIELLEAVGSGAAPGVLERALRGAPVRPEERDPVAVQHIVRSFDPGMVCTVH